MKEILFPVGRLVSGSLYRPQPVLDNFGKPVLGPDGKPKTKFSFGVAFPKNGTTHFGSVPDWGATIWAEGHAGFPNGEAQHPSFAWKIQDGDSTVPNKRGNKPADNEGWPGHWVVFFSGSYAPKTCNANGSQTYTEADGEVIKAGHFVQVYGSVKDNKPSQSPGVYINFTMVAHAGFGKEIAVGVSVDASKVGFGGALPAGASAVPLAQMPAPASAGGPAIPVAVPTAQPAPPVAAAPSAALPPITPNPAFLQPPVPVPAAAIPMPSAPSTSRQMTAKAAGHTREAMAAVGWSDDALIAQGYMTA